MNSGLSVFLQIPVPMSSGPVHLAAEHTLGPDDLFLSAVPGTFAHSTPQQSLHRAGVPLPFYSPLTPPPTWEPSSPLPSLSSLLHPLDLIALPNSCMAAAQPQPNITFPHISLNANPPQEHKMAGDPIAMPLRGSRDTPKFDGRTPAHLPCFFEDIEILGEAAQISEEAQIKAAIRYADLDEAEVWLTLTAASGRNWDAFVAAVKDLYPRCEGANRYCRADLQYLVQDYRSKLMRSQDDLGEYHRWFLKISAPLIANKKLPDTERDTFFLDGFPRAVADRVHHLSIIRADLHPNDAYPMEDVIEAAKFLLIGDTLRELLARPDDRG
ncbi:hypothetical protein PAXRUDRAFT_16430 [Paxillus rubicundulus Ve08.2h10]|uniref:Retrotransposon gag domain-containing protein n=1 Tax=Paxillus rubicundulus Ve08.2h10 TaxID=930991 RepID=A0A0D0D6F0_9AGAM|nr:hypothetical protein PAXRUDRAFT_16430 [Paxillus rubicundulus Ve08.2h10]